MILGNRLVPGFDELARLLDGMASDRARPADQLLAEAEVLDALVVLERRWDETLRIYEDEDDQEAMEVFDETLPPGPVPPIPAPLTTTSGTATVALLPAAAGEEVLAVLGWGDWNACPPPEEHVAVLREWRRRYGAVAKAISPDTLELAVARPPTSFDEAPVPAREQYAYAPDIVDQGEHSSVALSPPRSWTARTGISGGTSPARRRVSADRHGDVQQGGAISGQDTASPMGRRVATSHR